MRRRRFHYEDSAEEAAESGELNLVPYLDIITTLVIFLIFTFQVVVEFRLIELLPPAYSVNARKPTDAPSENDVTLTLAITTTGFRLLTNKAELGTADVPRKPNGDYDTEQLTQELLIAKKALGLSESLVLTASDEIEYSIVVAAMDAARTFEGKLLFPNVLLAKSSTGGGG